MNTTAPRFSLDRMLVLVALGCSLAVLLRNPPAPAQPDLQPIRDELGELRRSVNEAVRPQQTVAAPAADAVSQDGVTIRQVHEWAWGLEQRLVELEQRFEQTRAGAAPALAQEPDLAQVREAALDIHAPPEERLTALRTLRRANARTTDVVQAMLKLQASSQDARVRADIFRQLSGVKDAILKPPLIHALLTDSDPKVREEAAETLAPFLADPYVRSALSSAAQQDSDLKVQIQARETLQWPRER